METESSGKINKKSPPDKLRIIVRYALGTAIVLNTGIAFSQLFFFDIPATLLYLTYYTICFLFLPSLIAIFAIHANDFKNRRNIGFKVEKKLIWGIIISIILAFACSYIGYWISERRQSRDASVSDY